MIMEVEWLWALRMKMWARAGRWSRALVPFALFVLSPIRVVRHMITNSVPRFAVDLNSVHDFDDLDRTTG
jgi:hypothetical protein